MCFADTLERLKLGRPVVDVMEYLEKEALNRWTMGRPCFTNVHMSPYWYQELMRGLYVNSHLYLHSSFMQGLNIVTINLSYGSVKVVIDPNAQFIKLI